MFGASKLTDAFKNVPPTAAPSNSSKPLVNYIWINWKKDEDYPQGPVCTLNMGNIKRAVDNANLYPAADFRLWVDKKLMSEYSQFCINSYIGKYGKSGNISIQDLQEIPDYANDEHFAPLQPGQKGYGCDSFNSRCGTRNIYSRADYARILVLDHCMQTMPDRNRVIYSDIDCVDIKLKKALERMDDFGVAIYGLEGFVSHGYIALATDNPSVKKNFASLKYEARDAAHSSELGAYAFEDFLADMGLSHEKWHKRIGIKDLLPPMRTEPEPLSFAPSEPFHGMKSKSTFFKIVLSS